MKIPAFIRMSFSFAVFLAGALLFNISAANAVADLNVAVTDGGQSLGGATAVLTLPDGSSQTVKDDDNDGRFAFVLRSPGRYLLTITTADGRSTSTSFKAPSDGSVSVSYDAAAGKPRVSVNDTSSRAGSGSDWSWGLYGSFGWSDWNSQFFDGEDWFNGDDGKMRKFGIGGELRYNIPNSDFFLTDRFFYHAKGKYKDPVQIWSSYDVFMKERWRNQMMLGWSIRNREDMNFNLLAGFTLAKMNLEVMDGGSEWLHNSEVQFAPTFGAEAEWAVNSANTMFFVLGMTATIMNSVSVEVPGFDEVFRVDNDLQWDMHSGLRIPF